MQVVKRNYAFVDAQNLHLGTREDGWDIDLAKFRIYLKEKYMVSEAYYFLGTGKKKGNVDTDIVFEIMKNLISK